MHMSDALLSPVVGGVFWALSAGMIGWSSRKIEQETDSPKTVLMGVLGAFVFAAQMINFTIPGTGSSGHLGGGLLLTVLLGPWRAFITLASVLVIQALFFADGGLLALGANIFNLAFFPAFVAWPFIYRTTTGTKPSPSRVAIGSILGATAGLLMGSLSVVLQTSLSGVSDLPFATFMLFMLPIHAIIGIVEGVITWAVLSFIAKTEPALLAEAGSPSRSGFIILTLLITTLVLGGVLSWFASSRPDGLEWSITNVTGKDTLHSPVDALHPALSSLQKRLAIFPDYDFKNASTNASPVSPINPGTSMSGLVGSLMVLMLAGSFGLILRKRLPKSANP